MSEERDHRIRLAAFQWLRAQMDVHGELLPRSILAEGFVFEGQRVPLLGPQGIFRPAVMSEAPLSITTIPGGPYDDGMGSGGVLSYAYRGTDPAHPDNRGLRRAMERQHPLVYFYRVQPGQYLAAFPVFVVGDRLRDLAFDVAVDDAQALDAPSAAISAVSEDRAAIRREYVTAIVRRRVPAGVSGTRHRGVPDSVRTLPTAP
jgi:putative restriction endonuclease